MHYGSLIRIDYICRMKFTQRGFILLLIVIALVAGSCTTTSYQKYHPKKPKSCNCPTWVTKIRSTPIPPASYTRIVVPDLHSFLPENSAGYILKWFQDNPVHLRISKARSSKFGDYRAPINHIPARISVNRNLNKFDFLITLVHEMAHHEVYTEASNSGFIVLPSTGEIGRRPRPHGTEWKEHYRQLMSPSIDRKRLSIRNPATPCRSF
jgi:hypothetical protein